VGIELFERAAEAQGRLLRAEALSLPGGGSPSPERAGGYLITFDVGRIFVAADPSTGGLSIRQVESPDELSGELSALDDEDPWWRIIGNPITRVWPGSTGTGAAAGAGAVEDVRIQFREDQENPKVISLRFEGGEVGVSLEERVGG
jgi:hypothetical protein